MTMATDNDEEWNAMLTEARNTQQFFYELSADWTVYEPADYEYLKQNIGYALYGAPTEDEKSVSNDNTSNQNVQYQSNDINNDSDVIDNIIYKPEAKKVIDKIFEIAHTYGRYEENIYFGVVYNIIFCTKDSLSANKKENEIVKEKQYPVPVFKIRKYITRNNHDVWFIDDSGRVYQKWMDYLEHNNLPKCTMFYPEDGLYQPDPHYEITETYSTVWVKCTDSPRCAVSAKVLSTTDNIVSGIGIIGGIGLAVASFLTPVGPVVAGIGLATTGVSGAWTIGRSSQTLIDRFKHKQSIGLTDRQSLSAWVGIAGSTAGLALSGGTLALSKAVERGNEIGMIAKGVFNGVLVTDIAVNAVGIGLQGYFLYEKYSQTNTIDIRDVFFLGTHVLFFGSAVMNAKFASEIIRSSQGKILDDFRSTLKSKRHRKAFNRVKRNAAGSHSSDTAQNAEVIRYVNKVKSRQELLKMSGSDNANHIPNSSTRNFGLCFDRGKINVNGIVLFDPVLYAKSLLVHCTSNSNNTSSGTQRRYETNDDNMDIFESLKKLLLQLLTDLYTSDKCPKATNLPTVVDFDPLLREMKDMDNAEEILKTLCKIAFTLLMRSNGALDSFLLNVVTFLWNYAKMNIRKFINDIHPKEILHKVITAIYLGIEMIVNNLIEGLRIFLTQNLK